MDSEFNKMVTDELCFSPSSSQEELRQKDSIWFKGAARLSIDESHSAEPAELTSSPIDDDRQRNPADVEESCNDEEDQPTVLGNTEFEPLTQDFAPDDAFDESFAKSPSICGSIPGIEPCDTGNEALLSTEELLRPDSLIDPAAEVHTQTDFDSEFSFPQECTQQPSSKLSTIPETESMEPPTQTPEAINSSQLVAGTHVREPEKEASQTREEPSGENSVEPPDCAPAEQQVEAIEQDSLPNSGSSEDTVLRDPLLDAHGTEKMSPEDRTESVNSPRNGTTEQPHDERPEAMADLPRPRLSMESIPWSSPDVFACLLPKDTLPKLKITGNASKSLGDLPKPWLSMESIPWTSPEVFAYLLPRDTLPKLILTNKGTVSAAKEPAAELTRPLIQRLKRTAASAEALAKKYPKTVREAVMQDTEELSAEAMDPTVSLLEIAVKAGFTFPADILKNLPRRFT